MIEKEQPNVIYDAIHRHLSRVEALAHTANSADNTVLARQCRAVLESDVQKICNAFRYAAAFMNRSGTKTGLATVLHMMLDEPTESET